MSQPVKNQPSVAMRKGDYARALSVAERFNIKAGQSSYRKVKGVLKNALDFMETVAPIVKSGTAVETGSAWHGPDVFLDNKEAVSLARRIDRTDYQTGTFDLKIPKRDAQRLSSLRKTFRLSSEKQAAGLAIRVYQSVTDGIWRGNSFFSVANQNNQIASALDDATERVRKVVAGSRQP